MTPVLREPAQAKHGHVRRGILCGNSGYFSRGQRFVRACAVEMHMDMSQEPFCAEIYRENAGPVSRGKHFVRACAVEMHMDMSQEAFCAEIYKENAKRPGYRLN